MHKISGLIFLAILILLLTSCKKEDIDISGTWVDKTDNALVIIFSKDKSAVVVNRSAKTYCDDYKWELEDDKLTLNLYYNNELVNTKNYDCSSVSSFAESKLTLSSEYSEDTVFSSIDIHDDKFSEKIVFGKIKSIEYKDFTKTSDGVSFTEEYKAEKDKQTCEIIKSSFKSACSYKEIYKEILIQGKHSIAFTDGESIVVKDMPNFEYHLQRSLSNMKSPLTKGKSKYVISWEVVNNEVKNLEVKTE